MHTEAVTYPVRFSVDFPERNRRDAVEERLEPKNKPSSRLGRGSQRA